MDRPTLKITLTTRGNAEYYIGDKMLWSIDAFAASENVSRLVVAAYDQGYRDGMAALHAAQHRAMDDMLYTTVLKMPSNALETTTARELEANA
jgi:hypothetical protein